MSASPLETSIRFSNRAVFIGGSLAEMAQARASSFGFTSVFKETFTVVAKDKRITDVYHECRSQKIALCCAHQETSQVSEKVLSAFQNCAIRMSHPDDEARKMSISLRMDVRKLTSLKRGQFGAYVRGLSKEGIVIDVEKADLSQLNPSKQPFRATLARAPQQPLITLDDILEPVAATPAKAEPLSPEPKSAPPPLPQQKANPPAPTIDDSGFSPDW